MKYWNKSKKYRDAKWHVVDLPKVSPRRNLDIKRWCQQQPSKGRFYWSPYTNLWYFELSKDATWFALKWY